MVVTVRGDPARDVQERSVFLDLFHGTCREARAARQGDMDAARYALTADARHLGRADRRHLGPDDRGDGRGAGPHQGQHRVAAPAPRRSEGIGRGGAIPRDLRFRPDGSRRRPMIPDRLPTLSG